MTGEASWITLVLPMLPFFVVLGGYWLLTSWSLRHAHR
jgi:hypothetical protein